MNNDLISREALKKAINEEALNLSNGGRIFIENINKIIDNAPTEEARPTGKWIREVDWVHCSACGHEQNYPSNFCPNCGAKMEAGDRWKEEEE